MKKQNLNEEIARIKGMMGKIMTESFDGDMQPEMSSETNDFKVGDTVSDPSQLGPGPEFDGKIIAIYPNLEAVANDYPEKYKDTLDWLTRNPDITSQHDQNDTWYLIKWRTEGTNLYSSSDVSEMMIAPDDRQYEDYEEDDEEGGDDCSCCSGTGEGAAGTRCLCCGGSGSSGRDYGGPEPDDYDSRDYEDRGYEYGRFYDGN